MFSGFVLDFYVVFHLNTLRKTKLVIGHSSRSHKDKILPIEKKRFVKFSEIGQGIRINNIPL